MSRHGLSIRATFENFRQIYKMFTKEKGRGRGHLKYCLLVTALDLCSVSKEVNAPAFSFQVWNLIWSQFGYNTDALAVNFLKALLLTMQVIITSTYFLPLQRSPYSPVNWTPEQGLRGICKKLDSIFLETSWLFLFPPSAGLFSRRWGDLTGLYWFIN